MQPQRGMLAPPTAPVVSHHQHLISPETAALWSQQRFSSDELIKQIDVAGIRQAVVLSVAYIYADDRKAVPNERQAVQRENDWTAAQVARWPERLKGFCGINPLSTYALEEIRRCTGKPGMNGIKLHFGNSGVDLRNDDHAAHLASVFRAANERRTPIVIHMRPRSGIQFEAITASILLERLLPAAPASVVQVAHMAGSGPGYPDDADAAMKVLADAIEANDARTQNLFIDVTTVVTSDSTPGDGRYIAARLRQIGMEKVLFGADLSIGGNPPPATAWAMFRQKGAAD